ncbi:MAG: glycosyltransferase family 4 protein [Candidatus Eisenbacteria bacterium]
MRVLAVCADPGVPLDGTKGASVHLRAIWTALAREGCELHGIAFHRGVNMPQPVPGLHLRPVRPMTPSGGGVSSAPRAQQAGVRTASLATPTPVQAILAAARGIAADVVFERLALGSDAGLTLARELGVPLVVEVNAPLDEEAARFRHAPSAEDLEALKRTLAGAYRVQVVSEALLPWARTRGARDVRVLPNGVDYDLFASARLSRAERELAGEGVPVRVVFAGSFKPWHDVDGLLAAFAQALHAGANLELELIGDGRLRGASIDRAQALGINPRTRFTGAIDHDRMPERLQWAEIAVAPAPAGVDPYFSPLKLPEYAAAGCAIIAASLPQVRELFRDGEQIVLVPPGDTDALARELGALASDAPRRRRLGEAAAARAAQLDWSAVARQLIEWMRV